MERTLRVPVAEFSRFRCFNLSVVVTGYPSVRVMVVEGAMVLIVWFLRARIVIVNVGVIPFEMNVKEQAGARHSD